MRSTPKNAANVCAAVCCCVCHSRSSSDVAVLRCHCVCRRGSGSYVSVFVVVGAALLYTSTFQLLVAGSIFQPPQFGEALLRNVLTIIFPHPILTFLRSQIPHPPHCILVFYSSHMQQNSTPVGVLVRFIPMNSQPGQSASMRLPSSNCTTKRQRPSQ